MTLIKSLGCGTAVRDEAVEALELFDLASSLLSKVLAETREGVSEGTAKELAAYTKEVSSALKVLVTERQHVEKFRRDAGELGAGRDFDLDEARDEIGRRLARLRDAGGD